MKLKIIKNILILFLSLAIFGCSNTPKVDPNGKLRADNQSAGIYYDYFGKKVSYDEYMKVKSLDSDMEWFYKRYNNSSPQVMQTLYYAGREKEFKDLAYSYGFNNIIFPNGKNVKFFNPTYEKYTDLLQKENNETIKAPYSPKELIRISEKRAEVVEKEEKKQAIEESGDEHYTLMGFKEIRQDTPQTVRAYIKNEIYDKKNFYQKQQYYQSVIEPFIEGHDIRNEKDLYSSIALFIYDNSSGYIYEGARGGYIFLCDFPKDELTFSYSPKEIIEGLPSSITSVDDKINNLEEEIVANLTQMTNKKPILEEIKTEKIGDYNVRVREIKYNENTLYIYGLETDNQYFAFTSHLKYFLNAIVQKLNDKK